MIENNETGRRIRKYFIEVAKRYKEIIDNPANIFDFMRLALDQIEKNEHEISEVRKIALINREDIKEIKSKISPKLLNTLNAWRYSKCKDESGGRHPHQTKSPQGCGPNIQGGNTNENQS